MEPMRGLVWFLVPALLVAISTWSCVKGQDDETDSGDADYYRMQFLHDDAESVDNRTQYAPSTPYGPRPGSPTKTNSCQRVRAVPRSLRLSSNMKPRGLTSFYQKYTEAYGIPVISSGRVPDDALRRACYTLRFLLAGHSKVRRSFYKRFGRVGVIGKDEGTNWIPEHSNLPNWWNQRARGLGGTTHQPISTGGEENVLCYQTDRYRAQDIFLHESAHAVHLIGAAFGIPGWDRRLRARYRSVKAGGRLWARTYSMSTAEEYFAEGTQSYFNVNSYARVADGVRGPINTRPKLKNYDRYLYNMIREVFPCDNDYIKRCGSTRAKEDAQELKMDCDLGGGGKTGGGKTGGGNCTNLHTESDCVYWANSGECEKNPDFMLVRCQKACDSCPKPCDDKHKHCPYWKRVGECEINPDFMDVNCPKSCEKCP